MPARPHLLKSVFTHLDHVFQGLPFFQVPGIGKFVIDLMQDMDRCTWPPSESATAKDTSPGLNVLNAVPSQ